MTTALAEPRGARATEEISLATALSTRPRRSWTNILFIAAAHLAAAYAIVHICVFHVSWWTVGLAVLWYALCGFAITGGYHRLFSHRSHSAHFLVRLFHLLFGAASVQNSALKWSSDHRVHHSKTDEDEDPYSVMHGFWWAHIGWIFFTDSRARRDNVKDLQRDPLVRFQDRFYIPLAILFGVVVPTAIGFAWGDPLGALLVAGFLRLVVQWHATFSVNSVAHTIGSRPYSTDISARDSFWTALITMGEGYHNFHHRFQADYRNGIRWWQFDPTKWAIRSLSFVGLTRDLRRTPKAAIGRARASVAAIR
ncbi:MAG: fatty acid desaturase [Planctomycetota bacterium]